MEHTHTLSLLFNFAHEFWSSSTIIILCVLEAEGQKAINTRHCELSFLYASGWPYDRFRISQVAGLVNDFQLNLVWEGKKHDLWHVHVHVDHMRWNRSPKIAWKSNFVSCLKWKVVLIQWQARAFHRYGPLFLSSQDLGHTIRPCIVHSIRHDLGYLWRIVCMCVISWKVVQVHEAYWGQQKWWSPLIDWSIEMQKVILKSGTTLSTGLSVCESDFSCIQQLKWLHLAGEKIASNISVKSRFMRDRV